MNYAWITSLNERNDVPYVIGLNENLKLINSLYELIVIDYTGLGEAMKIFFEKENIKCFSSKEPMDTNYKKLCYIPNNLFWYKNHDNIFETFNEQITHYEITCDLFQKMPDGIYINKSIQDIKNIIFDKIYLNKCAWIAEIKNEEEFIFAKKLKDSLIQQKSFYPLILTLNENLFLSLKKEIYDNNFIYRIIGKDNLYDFDKICYLKYNYINIKNLDFIFYNDINYLHYENDKMLFMTRPRDSLIVEFDNLEKYQPYTYNSFYFDDYFYINNFKEEKEENKNKFSWVSLLATDNYLGGIIGLNESLKLVKSKYKLNVIVTDNLKIETLEKLKENNIEYRIFKRKDFKHENYNKITFNKFYAFLYEDFEKVCFLDADSVMIKNADEIFNKKPPLFYNHAGYTDGAVKPFICGAMWLISPDKEIFDILNSDEYILDHLTDEAALTKLFIENNRECDLSLDMYKYTYQDNPTDCNGDLKKKYWYGIENLNTIKKIIEKTIKNKGEV